MPLNIPYYNLEELLDIVLVNTKLSQYIIKGLIVGTLENDSVDTIEVNGSWFDFIELDKALIPSMQTDLFYVVQLKKKLLDFEVNDIVIIPESFINKSLTSLSQIEPSTFVIDFDYDYANEAWESKEQMMDELLEYVNSKLNVTSTVIREVQHYKEEDVFTILSLLKIYYRIDESENNKNSIKNILTSAANKQVVTSRVNNKKIEIYIDPMISNKLICTVYNKKNREVREFYF